MLTCTNLNKTYHFGNKTQVANQDISFEIKSGQMIWIYGNSGAGKTTLLNLLSGIDTLDSGEIFWGDVSLHTKTQNEKADFRLQNCGLIFQFFELIKTQSALNNALLPVRIAHTHFKGKNKWAQELFEFFGMWNLRDKKPNELSGGERQRVAIIRSLMNHSRYILADEVTASLDSDMGQKTYQYLKDYIKQKNGIGIFVSHDPSIKKFADAIYSMAEGKLHRDKNN